MRLLRHAKGHTASRRSYNTYPKITLLAQPFPRAQRHPHWITRVRNVLFATCSLMILNSRGAAPLALYPFAAVPNASMSLEVLWSKHTSRSAKSSAQEVAAVVPARNTCQDPAVRECRKRPAVPDVPRQHKTPKQTSNSFPGGTTDLGSGSSVVFQPNIFKQADSQRFYKALKVCRRK